MAQQSPEVIASPELTITEHEVTASPELTITEHEVIASPEIRGPNKELFGEAQGEESSEKNEVVTTESEPSGAASLPANSGRGVATAPVGKNESSPPPIEQPTKTSGPEKVGPFGIYGTQTTNEYADGRVEVVENFPNGNKDVTTTYPDGSTVKTEVRYTDRQHQTAVVTSTTTYADGRTETHNSTEQHLITGATVEKTETTDPEGTTVKEVEITRPGPDGVKIKETEVKAYDKDGNEVPVPEQPKEGEEEKPKEGEQEQPKEGEQEKPKEGEEEKPTEGEEEKPKEGATPPAEETPKTDWGEYTPSNGEYNNNKPFTTAEEGQRLNTSYENNQTAVSDDANKIATRTDLPEDHLSKLERDIVAEGVIETVGKMKELNATMEANLKSMQDCAKKVKDIKVRLEIKEKNEEW